MLNKGSKRGSISTEVAIGIALSVVALFIALGLFNENLSTLISNSHLGNLFNNSAKTKYDSFGRDYSNSQIEVQIVGAQGLAQLRKQANNKAIDIINNSLSSGSSSDADSLGYLSLLIKSIVGQPHICVYMTKDSDKFCSEDSIGGYKYYVAINSSEITVNDAATGKDLISINMDANAVSALNNSAITLASGTVATGSSLPLTAEGRSTLSKEEKLAFIQTITENVQPYISDTSVLMVKPLPAFKSKYKKILTGHLLTMYRSGIQDFVYKGANDPAGYTTNNWSWSLLAFAHNEDPSVAIRYVTYYQGKTDTLADFTVLLNSINEEAAQNAHTVYDKIFGSDFVNKALTYAKNATYNQFVYNKSDDDSRDGVPDYSSEPVSFYNNGKSTITSGGGRISGQNRICFTYDFAEGPGNLTLGNPDDLAALVVTYADTGQLVYTYIKYFEQYCNQNY